MISTQTQPIFVPSKRNRFLGLTAAILMASSLTSFAVSPGDREIQAKLPAGVTLASASATQLRDAAVAAIKTPSVNPNILPSSIVTAALARVPQFAALFAEAGLNKVFGQNGYTAPATVGTQAKKTSQASTITKFAILKGLVAPADKADAAAAITALAVNVVRAVPPTATTPAQTPLQVIVSSAVKAGLTKGVGNLNGAPGVVTGAVSQYAGVNNDNLNNNDSSDLIVKAILTTATKNAKARVLEIAEAAGYAFAATYLKTAPGVPTSASAFTTNNLLALVNAIKAGLGQGQAAALNSRLQDRVTSGIGLAYAGLPGPGDRGVNGFAFNNGTGTPVTNIQGF